MKLIAHPAGPMPALQIEADAHWQAGVLCVSFKLASAQVLAIPPVAVRPGFRDELWRHTCCELFIAATDAPDAYREFNFSPSGDWAAYAFSAYRDRETWSPATAPTLHSRVEDDALRLSAQVPPDLLPPGPSWQAGLAVVAETTHGEVSWWAPQHAGARPDFHLRAAMCLRIDRPDSFLP